MSIILYGLVSGPLVTRGLGSVTRIRNIIIAVNEAIQYRDIQVVHQLITQRRNEEIIIAVLDSVVYNLSRLSNNITKIIHQNVHVPVTILNIIKNRLTKNITIPIEINIILNRSILDTYSLIFQNIPYTSQTTYHQILKKILDNSININSAPKSTLIILKHISQITQTPITIISRILNYNKILAESIITLSNVTRRISNMTRRISNAISYTSNAVFSTNIIQSLSQNIISTATLHSTGQNITKLFSVTIITAGIIFKIGNSIARLTSQIVQPSIILISIKDLKRIFSTNIIVRVTRPTHHTGDVRHIIYHISNIVTLSARKSTIKILAKNIIITLDDVKRRIILGLREIETDAISYTSNAVFYTNIIQSLSQPQIIISETLKNMNKNIHKVLSESISVIPLLTKFALLISKNTSQTVITHTSVLLKSYMPLTDSISVSFSTISHVTYRHLIIIKRLTENIKINAIMVSSKLKLSFSFSGNIILLALIKKSAQKTRHIQTILSVSENIIYKIRYNKIIPLNYIIIKTKSLVNHVMFDSNVIINKNQGRVFGFVDRVRRR